MTDRLYYNASYEDTFKATVVDAFEENGRYAVILDKTLFYPTSGGQPHDTGVLGSSRVIDVTIRQEDGEILHWLDKPIQETSVECAIDFPRRFDHMQQHTGQHILSQAFIRVAQAETVGFHLSPESVTIDLDDITLTPEVISQAEELANKIIMDGRHVLVRYATREEAENLPLRKIPDIVSSKRIRLIKVEGFDLTACGGTHVYYSGEVGPLKILRTERRGKKLRVEFCCGWRTLKDYHHKNDIVRQLMASLSTGSHELPSVINKLQEENKSLRRERKKLQSDLLTYEAATYLQEAQSANGIKIVVKFFTDRPAQYLRHLQTHLMKTEKTIALLATIDNTPKFLFVRTKDAPGNMKMLLTPILEALGGSGGGHEVMAQGGSPPAQAKQIEQLLTTAAQQMRQQLGENVG